MMQISAVAALAGVPAATVRYYERRGLLAAPARTRAGYRQYGPETARRLRFIKHAQALGFSLDEIQDLLELRVQDRTACAQVAASAREKIDDIKQRIVELQRMQRTLEALVRSCRARRPTDECPVLVALSEADHA
jgi:MerR family mercuric resistance operon transcriptional regulator/MerR family gold-responsive transcriptional activator of gol and ges genes